MKRAVEDKAIAPIETKVVLEPGETVTPLNECPDHHPVPILNGTMLWCKTCGSRTEIEMPGA